jgi:hypothetical protein
MLPGRSSPSRGRSRWCARIARTDVSGQRRQSRPRSEPRSAPRWPWPAMQSERRRRAVHQAALDGTFGSLRPDLARRVRLVEHIRQAGAVMGGGVAHRETAHEAIGAIDRDMIFCSRTPERRFRPWASHLHPRAALARFKVQRASRSFWAIFAGEPSRFSSRPCAQSITATSIARSFSSRPLLSS